MIPEFLARTTSGTLPIVAPDGLPPAQQAAVGAAAWGVTQTTWAWIHILLNSISFLIPSLIGGLILWRVRTAFGLLTAYILLGTGSAVINTVIYSHEISGFALSIWKLSSLIWVFFFPWLYLFPDGRAVPRRLLWVFVLMMAPFGLLFFTYAISSSFTGLYQAAEWLDQYLGMVQALVIPLFVFVSGAQVYRYLKVSSPLEKVQTRWFVFGLVLTFVPALLFEDLLGWQAPAELGNLMFTALPIGIGISILRYRLWNIDVIIRKTLLYGALTGLLAIVFFGLVTLLQNIFANLSRQQSPVSIVLSTLAIAALFYPLRAGLQNFIDRRFYRRKYNAELALAQFSAVARNEVDINTLTQALLGVVEGTTQPEYIRLWLKR